MREVTTLEEAGEYLRGLFGNAQHHADMMFDIVPKFFAAAIAHMDAGSLRAYTRLGETKNAAWATFEGRRYFFAYLHPGDGGPAIVVKRGSKKGEQIQRFEPDATFEEIWAFVREL